MKRIFILICLLLFVQIVFGPQDFFTGFAPQRNPNGFSAEQKDNWQEWYNWYSWSFDCFYNHEYEKSIECLERALKLDSSQPAIYWRLSYVLWFTAQREYDQKRKIKDLEKRFNEITEEGIKRCEKLLEVNSENSEIMFYLGALYGHKGEFIATTSSWIELILKSGKILGYLKKSRKILRKIKPAAQFYYEALGYLGLYNYGIVVTPSGFKGKIKEDKNLSHEETEQWGYEELQKAIKNSRYSDDSIMMYRGILQIKIGDNEFKDRILEAIELTEGLLRRYPRNLSLKVDLVVLYWKNGWLIEAKEMGEKLYNEILSHPDYPKLPYTCYLLYRLKYKILLEIEKELGDKK